MKPLRKASDIERPGSVAECDSAMELCRVQTTRLREIAGRGPSDDVRDQADWSEYMARQLEDWQMRLQELAYERTVLAAKAAFRSRVEDRIARIEERLAQIEDRLAQR